MNARGIPNRFIKWVQLLLTTTTSSILLNGRSGESFRHFRGLRQGDPLSPFLFVIAVEVLSKMVQAAATSIPRGISDRYREPFFMLQYADDTLIFSTARDRAAATLDFTLRAFSSISGLHVNRSKSSIVTFHLTEEQDDAIMHIFQCPRSTLPIPYLGLSLSHLRPTKECFKEMITRIESRLEGWKGKLLSRAGRVLLTKAVLSAIPIYAMSVFKFPLWVIRDIDRIRKKFIWRASGTTGRGMHLLAWERVCLPKSVGGMGLHDLKMHNKAMLLRWWWLLHSKPSSQWTTIAKALLAKRNINVPPLLWNQNGSFFWKDLLTIRYWFQVSSVRSVGAGVNASFWFDNWGGGPLKFMLPDQLPPPKPFTSLREGVQNVHGLVPNPRSWYDTVVLRAVIDRQFGNGMDAMSWRWSTNGEFSVSSVYKAMMTMGKVSFPLKNIWKIRVPPTIRMFMFILASDRLLTQFQLSRRGITFNPGCVLCTSLTVETVEHLFFRCPYTSRFWTLLSLRTSARTPAFRFCTKESLVDSFSEVHVKSKVAGVLATGFWMIWLERNNRIFRSEARRVEELVESAAAQAEFFFKEC